MIRLLIGLVIALFAAVGLALLLKEDPGYLLLSVGQLTVETTVAAAIVILLLAFTVLYIAVRLFNQLIRLPRTVKTASRKRQRRNAQRDLARGMRELAEERWAAAEATLSRRAHHSDNPELHYVGAARAAHQLGVDWRRDSYLRRADNVPKRDGLIVGLAQAEFLLEEHKAAEAKRILMPLHHEQPRQPRVLKLLAQSYIELGEWASAKELLPRIDKSNALVGDQKVSLQRQIYRGLLADAARRNSVDDLKAIWHEVPHPLRHDDTLLIEQAGHLRDSNAVPEAEQLLLDALRHKWSEQLVVGYGELGRGHAAEQLQIAEQWLGEHGNDPYLLLTLGRLARRSRQLGKARSYLEDSIKLMPSPDAYQELGSVLDEMDDKDSADRCYRAGLRLLSAQPEEKGAVEVLPSGEGKEIALTKEGKTAVAQ